MSWRRISRFGLALILAGRLAPAASRPRYGGELRVQAPEAARLEAALRSETPMNLALRGLFGSPLCHLDAAQRVHPALARVTGRGALLVRLELPTAPAGAKGWPSAPGLTRSLNALLEPGAPNPYRALLAPLVRRGVQATPGGAELTLAHPWPDLEAVLCHPALSPGGKGPYRTGGDLLLAEPHQPTGRPYPDRLRLLAAEGERATWALQRGELDLTFTAAGDAAPAGPALFATYLLYRPARAGEGFGRVVEAAVDRRELVDFFVRPPAVPMTELLPPALMAPGLVDRPAPGARRPLGLSIAFDSRSADHRAVAERLQLRLSGEGYALRLEPLEPPSLWRRWAAGEYDLILMTVLLPPVAASALGLVMDLAGRRDLWPMELPALGAVEDPRQRAALAAERARIIAPRLPLVPLYAQGASLRLGPRVFGLEVDGHGLPRLDQLFLIDP